MVRREKRKRPSFGLPGSIALVATADGWRYSVRTEEGGMLCGRLGDGPPGPEAVPAVAGEMVRELALTFHGTAVEVVWEPLREPGSRTGRIVRVAGGGTAPAGGGE
ncbi:hypothetical protein [Streptomyces sp. CAU 1734]|uniref:hypothetical protein n=1 Tax=Streptomyces sp. CAU 1734 TaxID=3140360 RepID=UPI003260062C